MIEEYTKKVSYSVEYNDKIIAYRDYFLMNILKYDIATVHQQDSLWQVFSKMAKDLELVIKELRKMPDCFGNTAFRNQAIQIF